MPLVELELTSQRRPSGLPCSIMPITWGNNICAACSMPIRAGLNS